MSRIGKLKRQAIQEANERNLGLIKEQIYGQVTVPFREGDVIQFDDGWAVQLVEDPNVGDTLFVIRCVDGVSKEYQTGFLGSGPTTKENEWCSQGSAEVDCHSNPQIVDISACKNARTDI